MKIQVNSNDPYHAVIKEMVYYRECDQIRRPLTMLIDVRDKEKHGDPQYSFEWEDVRVMKK